jgi:peroxiredoxin Q/BCP
MPDLLVPGQLAPAFEAVAVGGPYGEGTRVSSSDFLGKTLILYFYPKDDTPGCTKQACALRDRYKMLLDEGAVIFGVNADSAASHKKFIEKYDLPFALLSDPDHSLVEAYGVWIEKSMYGKKFMGVERSTFVIRPDGRIKSIFRKVAPDEHADLLFNSLAHFEP